MERIPNLLSYNITTVEIGLHIYLESNHTLPVQLRVIPLRFQEIIGVVKNSFFFVFLKIYY